MHIWMPYILGPLESVLFTLSVLRMPLVVFSASHPPIVSLIYIFLGLPVLFLFQVMCLLVWISPLPSGCQYFRGGICLLLSGMFLKLPHPLQIISFRSFNIFQVYLVLVLCIFMIHKNFTLAIPFLFTTVSCLVSISPIILVLGCCLCLLNFVEWLCVSQGGVQVIGVAYIPPILSGIC